MSEQKPDPATPAAKAPETAANAAAGNELAGKLATKQMTIFDQIFIWTMILLVGIIFGVGPSIGLVMQGGSEVGSVDATQVQRRQRIAQALQEIIDPSGYRAQFSLEQQGYGLVQRQPESYAHSIRMAEVAHQMGLTPSKAEVHKLVDDFMARQDTMGKRSYAQMIADHRRAKDITDADLELWLSEQFALEALDARSSAVPVLPVAVAATFKQLREEKVSTDQVVLSAKPLLPEIKADDPELQSTYDSLATLDRESSDKGGRFVIPAATIVQVAAPDFAALRAATQVPGDEQAKAWYESHKADYKKPAPPVPANGQTPPPEAAPEYLPFEEVKAAVVERMRNEAASVAAHDQVAAFIATVEDRGLEQGSAEVFAQAATAAGLKVQSNVEIPDSQDGAVLLPGFGLIKRSAREIGLTANKPGTITDQQETADGQWLVLRLAGRKPAARKPIDDPEVRAAVSAALAGRRAYPLLLAEAEALRAQAEKAGPGGLRALFADPAVKAKWNVEVTTEDLSALEELTAPQPADTAVVRPEPRIAASLAVAGNPVSLAEVQRRRNQGDGDAPEVRLIQASGYTVAAAPTAEERTQMATQLRNYVAGRISAAAQAALGRKL